MANSLDSDQARHFVGLDLGSNCLQRSTADDTSRQIVKNSVYLACLDQLASERGDIIFVTCISYFKVVISQHFQ